MYEWIETEFGEFAFQLRDQEGGEPVNLSFSASHDMIGSRALLSTTRMLLLDMIRKQDGSEWDRKVPGYSFYAYLGADPEHPSADEEDLTFRLVRRSDLAGHTLWNTSENRAAEFRKNYWAAAIATLTICSAPGRPLRWKGTRRPIQTKISLGYDDPWWQGLFFRALEDLSRDQGTLSADITSALQLQAILREAKKDARGSEALELYYRLKLMLPGYEALLKEVVARPARRAQHRPRVFSLEPVTAPAFHRGQGERVQIAHVEQAVRGGTYIIPIVFQARETEVRPDPLACQFVRWSIRLVTRWMREVEAGISRYVERREEDLTRLSEVDPGGGPSSFQANRFREEIKQHETAAAKTNQVRRRLSRYGALLPVDLQGEGSGYSTQDSAVLSFDVRYSELRRLTLQLLQALRYTDYSPEAFPFEVEPWNVLYERWCFLRVLEALERVGFQPADGTQRLVTPFYRRPLSNQMNCVLVHEKLPGQRLQVWFERRYPTYANGTRHLFGLETRRGRTSYEWIEIDRARAKRTPDIALEFYTEGSATPRIVTLDPTLSSAHAAEKYEYREAIRSFAEVDEADGQSKRVVAAAWAIVPGNERTDDFLVPRDRFRTGQLVLRPDLDQRSARQLPSSLAKILLRCQITTELLRTDVPRRNHGHSSWAPLRRAERSAEHESRVPETLTDDGSWSSAGAG